MSYVGRSDAERRRMLASIGVSSFEELLRGIPADILRATPPEIGEPHTEIEQRARLGELSRRSDAARGLPCFLGGGMYDHFIPSALPRLVLRSEFLTAYTPYQPEVSQGTLTTIFEFQSMIAELTGLDLANASLYDGASAVAEACLVARAHTRRPRVLLAGAIHPSTLQVVRTIVGVDAVIHMPHVSPSTDGEKIAARLGDDIAAVVVAYPDFFGVVDDAIPAITKLAHEAGALVVASADIIALAALTPPGEWGADICVGEGQPLGIPMSFGGPALGYFAARKALVRRLPGRLVGQTVDGRGRRGYVLTLQTREQHIRRERATSNICTNQGLMALSATVYLGLLGKEGLREVADLCFQKSHYAAAQARERAALDLAYDASFFREFTLRLPMPAAEVCHIGRRRGILVGVDLGRFDAAWSHHLLVAVTEKRSREEIDAWADCLAEIVLSKRPRSETAVSR